MSRLTLNDALESRSSTSLPKSDELREKSTLPHTQLTVTPQLRFKTRRKENKTNEFHP